MRELELAPGNQTPEVIFSKQRGLFRISGHSCMEDAGEFYKELISWLEEYSKDLSNSSHFDIQFTSLNQSSMKGLLFFFRSIKAMQLDGHEVTVAWYVPKGHASLKEVGQDLSYMTDLAFEYFISEQHEVEELLEAEA